MDKSKKPELEFFEEYFKEDIEAIRDELKKSEGYAHIIDVEIDKLKVNTLGSNKGAQRYLIEHIENAVQLQSQKQSLRKDLFAIKKTILDYANKDSASKENNEDIVKLVEELISREKNRTVETVVSHNLNQDDLDDEIDKILNDE